MPVIEQWAVPFSEAGRYNNEYGSERGMKQWWLVLIKNTHRNLPPGMDVWSYHKDILNSFTWNDVSQIFHSNDKLFDEQKAFRVQSAGERGIKLWIMLMLCNVYIKIIVRKFIVYRSSWQFCYYYFLFLKEIFSSAATGMENVWIYKNDATLSESGGANRMTV